MYTYKTGGTREPPPPINSLGFIIKICLILSSYIFSKSLFFKERCMLQQVYYMVGGLISKKIVTLTITKLCVRTWLCVV